MKQSTLTSRWFAYPDRVEDHAERRRYAATLRDGKTRFVWNHSGRRSYKTETAKRQLIHRAINSTDKRFLIGAPTYQQVKRIYWSDIKAMIPACYQLARSDGEMWVRFKTGTEIHLAGMDKPERIEGSIWHGALLDETGNMKRDAIDEVLMPALADTKGFLWQVGVPEGRNHYFDAIQAAKAGDYGLHAHVFHWPSWEMMDAEEIERQRMILDERTFRQEFGGEFVTFSGRAYYAFNPDTHCAPVRDLYDPRAPLAFCFDFNVDPGVAVICQERQLPHGLSGTAVIGEVFIKQNSNTEMVCEKLAEDWGDHQGRIDIYGDASGGNRGSAKLTGSDWDIVRSVISRRFNGQRVFMNLKKANPPVRARVNAVNARIRNAAGEQRLFVDQRFAPNTVKDLEGVTIVDGSAGEISKKEKELSHLSDALGYYIDYCFPMGGTQRAKVYRGQ